MSLIEVVGGMLHSMIARDNPSSDENSLSMFPRTAEEVSYWVKVAWVLVGRKPRPEGPERAHSVAIRLF